MMRRGLLVIIAIYSAITSAAMASERTQELNAARQQGLAAFDVVASVLQSPRCANCHIKGNAPLQGDAGVSHTMRVVRGADGGGTVAMRCLNCHQTSNTPAAHAPPGAPHWRLPAAAHRMVFKDVSVGQLCRILKDPTQNGGRSLDQLVTHVKEDPLVLWGWNPGEGRTLPPIDHATFTAHVENWFKAGAPCR